MNKKIYAFFLPQFHECEQNNQWWGKGFTEWHLTRKAQPLFQGHYQPRIPQEGYYDYADVYELERQYQHAKSYGIQGFIMYDYWSNGERLLNKPLDLILQNPDIEFKFSICWANHSWTRTWESRKDSYNILFSQDYENTSEKRKYYFQHLEKIFIDRRYIDINGKPLYQIYLPHEIPNADIFIAELRNYMKTHIGKEIHISAIISGWQPQWQHLDIYDSITLFQPSNAMVGVIDLLNRSAWKADWGLNTKTVCKQFFKLLPKFIKYSMFYMLDKIQNPKPIFFEYDLLWQKIIEQTKLAQSFNKIIYSSAIVDYDNTPRRGKRALIMRGFTPQKFQKNMTIFFETVKEDIAFIFAWNEWSEGAYLQADEKYGNTRLEIIKELIHRNNTKKLTQDFFIK